MSSTWSPEFVGCVTQAVRQRDGRALQGGEVQFSCPEAQDHRNGDANPSASWNPAKAVWNCHACGSHGGILDLADRLGVPRPGDFAGKPEKPGTPVWLIRDAAGTVIAEHVRIDHADGSKHFFWKRNGKKTLDGLPRASSHSTASTRSQLPRLARQSSWSKARRPAMRSLNAAYSPSLRSREPLAYLPRRYWSHSATSTWCSGRTTTIPGASTWSG